MKRRARVFAIASLTLLTLFALPLPSDASGFPVHDILAFLQRVLAFVEQIKQVQHEAEQVQAAFKQLESYAEGGAWTDLFPLVSDLRDLYNRFEDFADGGNVGYLIADAEDMFRETFPGYFPPTFADHEEFAMRVDRATETLALITASLNLLATDNDDSATTLRHIQSASAGADGLLEELEVSNMYQFHQAGELQKGLQAQMLAANTALVGAAFEIQQTANATAARRFWLDSGAQLEPGEDPSDGFSGVPTSFRNLDLF